MTTKYHTPKEDERRVIERNGIAITSGITVVLSDENSILLKNHDTGDNIRIFQGDRKWPESETLGK